MRDACEKVVVVRWGGYEPDAEGIATVSGKDFFLVNRILDPAVSLRLSGIMA